MKCINCGYDVNEEMLQVGICFNCGKDLTLSIEAYNMDITNQKKSQKEMQKKVIEEKKIQQGYEQFQQMQSDENMLLTTTNILDGYSIKAYCGLVFGDTVIKMGIGKLMDASFNDLSDMISIGNKELSGSTTLLEQAREQAVNKMKLKAKERGANAIVGVNLDISYSSGVNYVRSYGTAVRIEKKE